MSLNALHGSVPFTLVVSEMDTLHAMLLYRRRRGARALRQGDSSTGVHPNLSGPGELCHNIGTLLGMTHMHTLLLRRW